MREERGQIKGDVVVYETFTLWGSIAGNVKVVEGGKFYLRGAVYGNMKVEEGGRVHVFGNLSGDLTLYERTKVIHSGTVAGDVTNRGGRLFIDKTAKIYGSVKTKSGATVDERAV
jgi:cytoskeletal protein CcmA (bactofilin family)